MILQDLNPFTTTYSISQGNDNNDNLYPLQTMHMHCRGKIYQDADITNGKKVNDRYCFS